MGVITQSFILFLASMSFFKTASTSSHFGMERMPLGGSLIVLDRVELSKRQDGDVGLGADCGGDPLCTTTSYGCECRYADESWVSELPTEEQPQPDEPAPEPAPPSPSPPKNEPLDPPGKLQCEPTPSGKYKDSHEKKVKMAAENFCKNYASSEDQDAAQLPIAKTLFVWGHVLGFRGGGFVDQVVEWTRGDDSEDDVYDFKVELVEDCKTEDGKLNLAEPVKDHECKDILQSAWKECSNKGRGGSLVAGCLTYSIVTKF